MYYLFLLGHYIAGIFPRKICYAFAKYLALLQFYISKKDRETVIYNLTPVVADKIKLRQYAKEVFINFAYYLVDFFRYAKVDRDFIKKYVKITGIENLASCLSKNKGAIVVTAHLGNYELAGAVTSLLGYDVYAIALPHKDKRIDEFFNHQRQTTGMRVIPTNTSIKRCFSLLKGNQLVAFLGDRDFFGGGLQIQMLSRTAILPRGPAYFALKTQADIVMAFFIREDEEFYHLIFEKPISVFEEGIKTEEEIIRRYAVILEEYIKKYPGQWYMFAKYWL